MELTNDIDVKRFKIGVVGAGSWGTALANLLATKGFPIDLWVFEKEIKEQILKFRENKIFLPMVNLSSNIIPTNNLAKAVFKKNLVLVVVPSHVMRRIATDMASYTSKETIFVSASKGIENKTHLTMTGVLQDIFTDVSKRQFVALSGPSFAEEVSRKLPTVVTVASADHETATLTQQVFANDHFRVYTSEDVIGVELGGALKNVIAIAAGVCDGLKFGLNARAALITRGMTEIRRLGIKMGADPRTFAGLTGFGDLILTCTGHLSRNYTVGKKIGQGSKINDILSEMRMVAEGVKTAKSVYNLSRKIGVDMPIFDEAYRILYQNASPKEATHRLMTRELKQELDDI